MRDGLSLGSSDLDDRLSKSDTLEKIGFEATVSRGVQAVFKAQDEFLIWGPASVEIVDKEGDKISVEALDKALPQLLKRARLSLEHTDQIVGRILERFETQEPVTVEINGTSYERNEFPTSVLDLDDDSPPALYVAGEIFEDTQQSKRAREQIEDGELTSYSISGEALVTRKKVEEGTVYDDILDLDLSAVTLCQEGMNQGASYAKVEGEVSDKELAGESAGDDVDKHRQEVPVLQHPSAQATQAIGKSMSDKEGTQSEKSEELSLEDLDKRLPEDGEIATKADVETAKSEAVEAFKESALPEGDLATVKYVEQLVDEKIEEKEFSGEESHKDISEEVLDLAEEHGLSPGAVVEILEAAEDEDEDEDEMGDEEDYEDKGEEDFPDDEEEDEEDEEPDFPDDDEKEGEEPDFPDDEEEEEEEFVEDDGGEVVEVEVLEEELPSDVWDVVSEYVELSRSDKSEQADKSEGDADEEETDIAKEVENILNNDVDGGTAIPTGDEEDQVDKQYSETDEEGEVPERSPALAHWE